MKKSILITLAICFAASLGLKAQNKSIVTAQPKIMVIPFAREGEDIRTMLDNDENRRIIMTEIQNAFNSKGFQTVDFFAKLKAMQKSRVINMDNRADFKDELVKSSGADIYVEADNFVKPEGSVGKEEKYVVINLKAYDVGSGMQLASVSCQSNKFFTDDIAALSKKALQGSMDNFFILLQSYFNKMIEEGRLLSIMIGFEAGSAFDMNSEVGKDGYLLSELIDKWFSENSYKNNYQILNSSDNSMELECNIPLKDKNNRNYNYTTFFRDFRMFLKSNGITITTPKKTNGGQYNVSIK